MFGIVVPSFLEDIIPERVSIKSIKHQKHKHQNHGLRKKVCGIISCETAVVISRHKPLAEKIDTLLVTMHLRIL